MIRMMQQLVVGGGQNSSSYSQGGPRTENENQLPQNRMRTTIYHPQGNDPETDPSKDKTPESRYDQVKSQVETLAKNLQIIGASSTHGSVDLDSLTNFPQVVMPPKFKTPKFIKYDGTRDPCVQLCMFCKEMAPYRDNNHLLCKFFLIV